MPIFEYRCRECHERFERLLPRARSAAPACPRCAGHEVERLMSTFAVATARHESKGFGPCGSDDCACRREARE